MNEIKCPNCGQVFTIDESDYESLLKQVRDHQFNEEIKQREKAFNDKLESELKLVKSQTESENQKLINDKDRQIKSLKNELSNKDTQNELVTKQALEKLQQQLNEKELKISELNNTINNIDTAKKLELNEAIAQKESEINKLITEKNAQKLSYEQRLEDKEEEIARYKDFKAKQNVKLIGESLEQHCLMEYDRILRPILKNAYFEKDNDSKDGSKGDFIFRDYDVDNDIKTEIISIMFEMKNEADDSVTKHKNEDFFDKLDKDRKAKKCEYAILVSMLEADSELYNSGIVDVSHKYPKMYVIRPQFFIPLITFLRNVNMNGLEYKKQLIIAQSEDLDFTHFEDNMNAFKEAFGKRYQMASNKFESVIEDIDKSIKTLENIKKGLLTTADHLRIANDKAQELSVKKLTVDAPSIAAKIEAIKKK